MKRLAAVLLAVGMIFGSVALRNSVEKVNTGDDSGSTSGKASEANPGAKFRLKCASDLVKVCKGLQAKNDLLVVSIEPAGTTADTLTKLADRKKPDFDAWLTVGPWAEIVNDNRKFTGKSGQVLAGPSKVLASSPTKIGTLEEFAAALTEACSGSITWKCLGENPSLPQPQSIGMASPNTGVGLAVLTDATNSYFANNDYSVADFEDQAFIGWFEQLTKKSRAARLSTQTPLEVAIAKQGAFTTVGAVDAEVQALQTFGQKYTAVAQPKDAPAQPVQAQVQLLPAAEQSADKALEQVDRQLLNEQLAAAKWNIKSVAAQSNMPSPGVLQVLRAMWDT